MNTLKFEFENSAKIADAIDEHSEWFRTKKLSYCGGRDSAEYSRSLAVTQNNKLQKKQGCKIITQTTDNKGEAQKEITWKIPFDIRDYSDLS